MSRYHNGALWIQAPRDLSARNDQSEHHHLIKLSKKPERVVYEYLDGESEVCASVGVNVENVADP